MDRFSPPDDRRPLRISRDRIDDDNDVINAWKIRRDMDLEERAKGGEQEDGSEDA